MQTERLWFTFFDVLGVDELLEFYCEQVKSFNHTLDLLWTAPNETFKFCDYSVQIDLAIISYIV